MSEKKGWCLEVGKWWRKNSKVLVQVRLRNVSQLAKEVSWKLCLLMCMDRGGERGGGASEERAKQEHELVHRDVRLCTKPQNTQRAYDNFKIGLLPTTTLNYLSLVQKGRTSFLQNECGLRGNSPDSAALLCQVCPFWSNKGFL